MTSYDFDIGIIGGGAAGLTVASGSAQLGAKTLLVEKEKELGGDCLHFGCVPSKTLIKAANVYHMMKNAARFGLPEIEVPPVKFKNIVRRIQAVIAEIQKHDSEERFRKLGVKVAFGKPHFIDQHAIQLNGNTWSARNWVLATGSSPSVPPIKGIDQTAYITNNEIFSLDHMPASMIFIGGGAIGCELAQAFCRMGSKVTVVDIADQILLAEDRDMADALMEVLHSEGVDFHLKVSVEQVRDLGTEKEVIVKNAQGKLTSLKAEVLMLAAGRSPNVLGLGLENIGLEFDRQGVKVDDRMRTNRKHIYAAGDVTGRYLFTHAAGYEGGLVVSNAVFHLPRKSNYRYLPWCTFTEPELASIGMNEARAKDAGIEYSVWTEAFKDNDRNLLEGERVGKIKMILDGKENPIGVQILGPHAGELIGEWVALFSAGIKLSILAAAVQPYPTVSEISKRVAGAYFAPKIFSEKIHKGLKFFFQLKGRTCGKPHTGNKAAA